MKMRKFDYQKKYWILDLFFQYLSSFHSVQSCSMNHLVSSRFPISLFLMSVSLLLTGCGVGGGSQSEPDTLNTPISISVSGKLAQAYVEGATIIADKKESGSTTGNCLLDSGETSTVSSSSGDFSLSVKYGDYVICSTGGTYKDSDGNSVDAAPMMTPAPESDSTDWNMTPLTTLVTTQPSLKTKLDELGGWNTDIASSSGVPSKLLRVAKTVETFWQVSKRLTGDSKKQLKSLNNLALAFKDNGVPTDNTSLKNLTASALETSMNDSSINTDAKDISEDALKDILKTAIDKVTAAVPDSDQNIVEKDVQDKFDDAKDELDNNTTNTLIKKPILKEIAPIGNTENTTPFYTFSSTYGGTILYSGDCNSSTTTASNGKNTIQLNSLSAGTYTNCSLTVTSSNGQVSDSLSFTSFTIIAKVDTSDDTVPTLAMITAVDELSITNSPTFVFFSTEAGKIKVSGSCQSKHQNAVVGENSMFSFSDLSIGTYSNCKITVTDSSGNESNALSVPSFQVVKTATLNSGIGFNPVISKIKCTIFSTQHFQIIATVTDDGPIGNLKYRWSFDKIVSDMEIEGQCGRFKSIQSIYDTCKSNLDKGYYIENDSMNPIQLGIRPEKGNANSISGTLTLIVEDLGGGTSQMDLTIQPNSC